MLLPDCQKRITAAYHDLQQLVEVSKSAYKSFRAVNHHFWIGNLGNGRRLC